MRTMLILVLLCSLAHWAQSSQLKPEGCGSTYVCIAPKMCENIGITSVSAASAVELSDDNTKPACPAVIKFHQYTKSWMYVSIESLLPSTTSIELYTTDLHGSKKARFKCANTATETIGTHGSEEMVKGPADFTKPMKCTFEIKLNPSDDIFKEKPKDGMFMDVDDVVSFPKATLPSFLQCDPNDLKFEIDKSIKPTEVYRKIEYDAGKYFCEDKNSKMEYRTKENDPYMTATTELTCRSGQYFVNSVMLENNWIYIRCVTEAHFFCDYSVDTVPGKDGLQLDSPDLATNKKGSLKCPQGFPHLFIDKLLPVTNPTIECHNFGRKQYWTVIENNAYLEKNKQKAYCSKNVDCNLRHKIPAKSIEKGFVNSTDFLPACRAHGTLHVNNQPVTVKCDGATGHYQYTIGQETKNVEQDTKFVCIYELIVDKQKDLDDEQFVQNGLFIVIGSVFSGFAVIVIASILIARCGVMREKRKAKIIQEQGQFNFLMNEKEKKIALKKRNPKEKQQTTEPLNWNKYLMNVQLANQQYLSADPLTLKRNEPLSKTPCAIKNLKDVPPQYAAFNRRENGLRAVNNTDSSIDDVVKRYSDNYNEGKKNDAERLKMKIEKNKKDLKPAPKPTPK